MSLLQYSRQFLVNLTFVILILSLTIATTCPGLAQSSETTALAATVSSRGYEQLKHGPDPGQDYTQWIVQATQGLIQKAAVHDNDKLEVVLAPKVRSKDVQPLIRSLAQSFQQSYPGQDSKVLVYSPNQQLVLTARVDDDTVKLTVH